MTLIAVDVAVLLPPDIAALAMRLSAALPREWFKGLRLDADHLPHITLAQLFVAECELPSTLERLHDVLMNRPSLTLRVTGGGRGTNSVWMAIERSDVLQALHATVMDAVAPYERQGGTGAAFADEDARPADVQWVASYRTASSFDRFTPHITLGHAPSPPPVPPVEFVATTVAACHLGKYCTCRSVLRRWHHRD